MSTRVFTVQRLIARTPWDVYEFLADESLQSQWRERGETHGQLVEAEPYTSVEYSSRWVFTIEPQEENTLLTLTRTIEGSGTLNRFGLWFLDRSSRQQDMAAVLARVEAAVVFDI